MSISSAPKSVRLSLLSVGLADTFAAVGLDMETRPVISSRFELRDFVELWAAPDAVRFFRDMPNPSRILVNNEAAELLSMYVGLKWSALARAGFRRVDASGPAALFQVRSTRYASEGVRVPAGASSVIVLGSESVIVRPLTF